MTLSADELRKLVVEKLRALGFQFDREENLYFPETSKEAIRRLHEPARRLELARRQKWLRTCLPRYLHYFADGHEVIPEKINPTLVEVETREQQTLFRIARLLWSLPFSKGLSLIHI